MCSSTENSGNLIKHQSKLLSEAMESPSLFNIKKQIILIICYILYVIYVDNQNSNGHVAKQT